MKKNPSKVKPVEFKVIVELDEVESKTKGGIIIPLTLVEKQQMTQVLGTLIAVGGNCFEEWKDPIPKIGDRVYVARAAGYVIKGADGKEYKLMNDQDIAALIGD